MRFKDKIVLITGSSRGIGKAAAFLFAREGATVVINCDRQEAEGEAVVRQIKKDGFNALFLGCDVSDEQQVKHMIAELIRKFRHIDILVNNAGIVFDVPFENRTVVQWKRTLDVNLLGVFLCSKYAAKHMPPGSKIVNIASTNGINTISPDAMDYDASKAGIIVLTKDLAKQLAPNITVNSVSPGWVDTDMNKELPKSFIREEKQKIYLKRFAQPEEIAKTILFLSSEEAGYITGTNVVVDGGRD